MCLLQLVSTASGHAYVYCVQLHLKQLLSTFRNKFKNPSQDLCGSLTGFYPFRFEDYKTVANKGETARGHPRTILLCVALDTQGSFI